MDMEIQEIRQALVDRRDAFQRAIDAFDVALGLGAIDASRELGGGAASKGRKKAAKAARRTKAAPAAKRAGPTGGRAEVAQARDAAIKAALRKGPTASGDLLAVLPKEPGQTAEQRQDALRNALSRMRIRKEIRAVDDGWALA